MDTLLQVWTKRIKFNGHDSVNALSQPNIEMMSPLKTPLQGPIFIPEMCFILALPEKGLQVGSITTNQDSLS